MTVRILLVDDHPAVRRGLRALLLSNSDWQIVDEAEDGVEAIEKAGRLQPDVIVLDISMPRMDGLEACRRIRASEHKPEVLFVTQHDSPRMMSEAIIAGARGYVVKSNLVRDLVAAVEAVSQHGVFPSELSR
jgi:DNA-binding NarL/FixJ family response regulator